MWFLITPVSSNISFTSTVSSISEFQRLSSRLDFTNVPLAQRQRHWHKIEGIGQWLDSRIKEHGLFQIDWCSHNGDDAPGLTRLIEDSLPYRVVPLWLWKLLWIPRSSWCRDGSSGFWVPRGCLVGADNNEDCCEVIIDNWGPFYQLLYRFVSGFLPWISQKLTLR